MTSKSVRFSSVVDAIAQLVDRHSRGEVSNENLQQNVLELLDPLSAAVLRSASTSAKALLERVVICVLALRLVDRQVKVRRGRPYVHVKCLGCGEPMWTAEMCPHFYCDDCASAREWQVRVPVSSSARWSTSESDHCYHGSDPDRQLAIVAQGD